MKAVRLGLSSWAVALVIMTSGLAAGPAASADLPPRPSRPIYHPLPEAYAVDQGPASTNGYYGYYGYDILGVPYRGLYSEDVTCIRSIRTPYGYRTVDVCR